MIQSIQSIRKCMEETMNQKTLMIRPVQKTNANTLTICQPRSMVFVFKNMLHVMFFEKGSQVRKVQRGICCWICCGVIAVLVRWKSKSTEVSCSTTCSNTQSIVFGSKNRNFNFQTLSKYVPRHVRTPRTHFWFERGETCFQRKRIFATWILLDRHLKTPSSMRNSKRSPNNCSS